MNENTKLEVAREIMNTMIAKHAKNGYDSNNKNLITLFNDEKEMNKFNFKVIDKILNFYGDIVKRNKGNE